MSVLKCLSLALLTCFITSLQAKEIKIVPLSQLKSLLTYTKIHDPVRLRFTTFPLSSSYSATWGSPIIPGTFLVKIPHGAVYSQNGHVIVDKKYLIKELL